MMVINTMSSTIGRGTKKHTLLELFCTNLAIVWVPLFVQALLTNYYHYFCYYCYNQSYCYYDNYYFYCSKLHFFQMLSLVLRSPVHSPAGSQELTLVSHLGSFAIRLFAAFLASNGCTNIYIYLSICKYIHIYTL